MVSKRGFTRVRRSDDRGRTRQRVTRLIHQTFTLPKYHRIVLVQRHVSTGEIRQEYFQERPLHHNLQKCEIRNKTVLNYQFGNVIHLKIGTRNKTVLIYQFGNNVFHLQIETWNKTVLTDQFGNNVFYLQIGTRNKTVLNDQFGNNVFHVQTRTWNKTSPNLSI